MFIERLPGRPERLNLIGDSLTVYCADNVLYHYGIHVVGGMISSVRVI